jgi:hypothetical protein
LHAEFDRITKGGKQTGTASDHLREARDGLTSVTVTPGMFGGTPGAADAEDVMFRAHGQQMSTLDDNHRILTWISDRTATVVTALAETDQAGGDALRWPGSTT